jgi:ectoine hydroxylase-related dioxygenase (phytanoyl-CoA dioxygenase family)
MRDGVAVVRGLVDHAWIDRLLPAAEQAIARAWADAADSGFPPNLKNLWRQDALFRSFAFESGVAPVAAAAAGAHEVRLLIDQIWAKPPHSVQRTRWHCDRPAWPVAGMMLPSVWMALTPIRAENCLEFVAGSHAIPRDEQSMQFVDCEEFRDAPDARFLAWDLEPGDALVFHPLAYHGCRGNSEAQWRIALTTRWAGNDIRYAPQRRYIDEGLSFAECRAGQALCGPEFPKVWPA